MNKFFSELTPVQKKIFYVAVAVVALALFDRLLVGPTTSRLNSINESIQNEENSIKGDLRFLAYKDRINKEAKAYEPFYAKGIPREEEVMASFLEKIDTLVKQSDLTLLKNNRSNEQKDPSLESKDYFVYRAELEVSGNLENIAKLMYAINTSPEFLKIMKMNLAMKKNGDVEEMKAVFTVAKYIIADTSTSDGSTTVAAASAQSK